MSGGLGQSITVVQLILNQSEPSDWMFVTTGFICTPAVYLTWSCSYETINILIFKRLMLACQAYLYLAGYLPSVTRVAYTHIYIQTYLQEPTG